MEQNENIGTGPTKRQIVLYAGVGLIGIVFFAWILQFANAPMSDRESVGSNSQTVATSTYATTTPNPTNNAASSTERKEFTFEVVATPSLRTKGLSGRSDVPQDYGMLFVFPEKDRYGFWMKDMKVSIDIIWLSDTGAGTATIVGIEDSVSDTTYPKVFKAPEPVRYVLETRAGEARRQGWSVGTMLSLPSGIPVPQ